MDFVFITSYARDRVILSQQPVLVRQNNAGLAHPRIGAGNWDWSTVDGVDGLKNMSAWLVRITC